MATVSNTAQPSFNIVVAMDINRGIGWKNGLPWPTLRTDREHYIRLASTPNTSGKKVIHIMGRSTFESRPEFLNEQWKDVVVNIVISTSMSECPKYVSQVVRSFNEALQLASTEKYQSVAAGIWIIGGEEVYKNALCSSCCQRVYLTRIYDEFNCDRFMPEFEDNFDKIREPAINEDMINENGIYYNFEVYVKRGNNILSNK